ncbi:MAG: hypothetical protein QXT84_02005 [Candidatus Bathyarchaeia archaeon]
MKDLVQLFRESHIITGTLALILTVVAGIIWVKGGNIPQELNYLLVAIYGYFFGARLYEMTRSNRT